MIGKDRHWRLRAERLLNLRIRGASLLECPIAIALTHRPHQDVLHLRLGKLIRERSRRLLLVLLVKSRLQVFRHMLKAGLLGILLHPRIYRSVHLQAVGIYAVIRTIFLLILVTPAIQRVIFPVKAVYKELHFRP